MPQLTVESQTIFAMAWLANVNAGVEKPKATELQDHAQTQVTAALATLNGTKILAPNLKLAWGPVTSTSRAKLLLNTNSVTDNTMFVVSCDDPSHAGKSMYVVAIAGTDPDSSYDWFNEDMQVAKMKPFSSKDGQHGFLAEGTYEGAYDKLLPMRPRNGVTLQEFLKVNVSKGQRILVTGHSLGGALAPVIAILLKDDPTIAGNVECYPFAGPTPGDKVFADYVASRFREDEYRATVNPLDIVPKAWIGGNLSQVPGIYGPSSSIKACGSSQANGLPPSDLVLAIVSWAKGLAKQAEDAYHTTYAFPGGDPNPTGFSGLHNDLNSDTVQVGNARTPVCEFLKQRTDTIILLGVGPGTIYHWLNTIWNKSNPGGKSQVPPDQITALLAFFYEAGVQHTAAYKKNLLSQEIDDLLNMYVNANRNTLISNLEKRAIFIKLLQDVAKSITP